MNSNGCTPPQEALVESLLKRMEGADDAIVYIVGRKRGVKKIMAATLCLGTPTKEMLTDCGKMMLHSMEKLGFREAGTAPLCDCPECRAARDKSIH